MPNRFLGVIGGHDGFPIQKLALSNDSNVCASIGHDEQIRFWDVENLKSRHIDAQSKSKSKVLKNKKLNLKGKSDNFFADLIENDQEHDDDDGDDDDDNDDDDDSSEDGRKDSDEEESSDSD